MDEVQGMILQELKNITLALNKIAESSNKENVVSSSGATVERVQAQSSSQGASETSKKKTDASPFSEAASIAKAHPVGAAASMAISGAKQLWNEFSAGSPGIIESHWRRFTGENVRAGSIETIEQYAKAGVKVPDEVLKNIVARQRRTDDIRTEAFSKLQMETNPLVQSITSLLDKFSALLDQFSSAKGSFSALGSGSLNAVSGKLLKETTENITRDATLGGNK